MAVAATIIDTIVVDILLIIDDDNLIYLSY